MTTTTVSERLEIRSSDDVVRVRQRVRAAAVATGLSLVDQTKVVTAASELARNTLDHGGGGRVDIDTVEGARKGVVLVFSDEGKGIKDIDTALRDGYTTGGGLGLGLGRRQAPVQRVRHRVGARQGHAHPHRALEMTTTVDVPSRRREPGRGREAAGRGTGRHRGRRRRAAGPARAGGDRAGHQPAQARGRQGASWWWWASTPASTCSRSTPAPAWTTSVPAWPTATRPPGHRATALGAVRRQCEHVHVLSWRGVGTAVLARLGVGGDDAIGALVVPMPGQESCGDAWSSHADAGGRTVLVVDGLGHGPEAATAAHAAVREFQRCRAEPPQAIVEALHQALRPTRGGAVAVARIDRASDTVSYAGVGNIAAALAGAGGGLRRLVSHNGTAGLNARRMQAFDYPGARNGLLVMHSDGISASWSLDRYPGLARAHPLLVAGVLYHHHARGRDDAAIVVARCMTP